MASYVVSLNSTYGDSSEVCGSFGSLAEASNWIDAEIATYLSEEIPYFRESKPYLFEPTSLIHITDTTWKRYIGVASDAGKKAFEYYLITKVNTG